MKANAPFYAGTPEEYFVPHPSAPKEINIDVLLTCLDRSQAILMLLQADGETPEGFSLNHGLILSALGAIDGLLEQAKKVVLHGHGRAA
jgi:hypothetical protein